MFEKAVVGGFVARAGRIVVSPRPAALGYPRYPPSPAVVGSSADVDYLIRNLGSAVLRTEVSN